MIPNDQFEQVTKTVCQLLIFRSLFFCFDCHYRSEIYVIRIIILILFIIVIVIVIDIVISIIAVTESFVFQFIIPRNCSFLALLWMVIYYPATSSISCCSLYRSRQTVGTGAALLRRGQFRLAILACE